MIFGLLLIACVIAVYWPSRYGELIFDDIILAHDIHIKTGNLRYILKNGSWRRLTHISYALNVRLTGWFTDRKGNPDKKTLFGFHAFSVAIHILNSFILWYVFSLITPHSFLAAFIFSIHPLCSQGVAYISGRSSVLAATFAFLSVGFMLSGYAVPAVLFMGLACLAKQDSVSGFGILAVIGWIYTVPYWGLALAVPVIGLWWNRKACLHLLTRTGYRELQDAGFPSPLKTPVYQITAFTESVRRLPSWILATTFNVDPKITTRSWASPALWMGVTAIFAVILAAGSYPLAMLSLVLILIPMVPYWIIPMPDPVMENRMYGSVAGIGLAISSASLPPAVLATLICVFVAQTLARSWYWSNLISLWNSVLWNGGREDRALINLGMNAVEAGDSSTARNSLAEALRINPNLAIARCNLALLDKREGRLTEAIEGLQETVKRTPKFYQGWFSLGCALETAGRREEGVMAHSRAITLKKWEPSVNRLGLISAVTGHLPEAERYFRQALRGVPYSLDYAHNFAWSLKLQGRESESIAMFKQLPRHYQISTEMLTVQKEV